jgi:hypothetical protein
MTAPRAKLRLVSGVMGALMVKPTSGLLDGTHRRAIAVQQK